MRAGEAKAMRVSLLLSDGRSISSSDHHHHLFYPIRKFGLFFRGKKEISTEVRRRTGKKCLAGELLSKTTNHDLKSFESFELENFRLSQNE